MPGHSLDGKMRAQLRGAILAGFSPASLDQLLNDNEMLRPNIAIGPDFSTRVNSLIEVAHQEGWLIELCRVLAEGRAGNQPVNSALTNVQNSLMAQRDTNIDSTQFLHDVPQKSVNNSWYLRLLSIGSAALVLVGVAAWVFSDRKPSTHPTISTSGPNSPVISGTKGNVQIEFGKSPPPMNIAAPPMNAPPNAAGPAQNSR